MYILYLGDDPIICMTKHRSTARDFAKAIITFNDEKVARKHAANNDDKMIGYPYYSCWLKDKLIFMS
jgi:hypothetical protein